MKTNPSQYSGTLKHSVCTLCTKCIDHLNAEDQEKHVIECAKQEKLF